MLAVFVPACVLLLVSGLPSSRGFFVVRICVFDFLLLPCAHISPSSSIYAFQHLRVWLHAMLSRAPGDCEGGGAFPRRSRSVSTLLPGDPPDAQWRERVVPLPPRANVEQQETSAETAAACPIDR